MAILEAESLPLQPIEDNDGAPARHLHAVEDHEAPAEAPELTEQVALGGVTKSISEASARRAFLDRQLVAEAQAGDAEAMDNLLNQYAAFVRLRANSYFLAGGDNDDLIQEGMIGLYKAIKDFNPQMGASFWSFANLCITRQLITAIKAGARLKHMPLNNYVSFQTIPAKSKDKDITLGDALPGPVVEEPPEVVISTQEIQSLVLYFGNSLSALETQVLRMHIAGYDYDEMCEELGVKYKAVDNALQRAKRKIVAHQKGREVLL